MGASTSGSWDVVVPVKAAHLGKSRLGATPELARAIAADSIAAVRRAGRVARVVVVTADDALPAMLLADEGGAELVIVAENAGTGIAAALRAGLTAASDSRPRAALLGDVPALLPEELDAALAAAARVPRAFVPDADGVGTVLVTASAGTELREAFGAGSAAAHRALGLVELPVPSASGLRRDVDTAEQLAQVVARMPASRTARAAAQRG